MSCLSVSLTHGRVNYFVKEKVVFLMDFEKIFVKKNALKQPCPVFCPFLKIVVLFCPFLEEMCPFSALTTWQHCAYTGLRTA